MEVLVKQKYFNAAIPLPVFSNFPSTSQPQPHCCEDPPHLCTPHRSQAVAAMAWPMLLDAAAWAFSSRHSKGTSSRAQASLLLNSSANMEVRSCFLNAGYFWWVLLDSSGTFFFVWMRPLHQTLPVYGALIIFLFKRFPTQLAHTAFCHALLRPHADVVAFMARWRVRRAAPSACKAWRKAQSPIHQHVTTSGFLFPEKLRNTATWHAYHHFCCWCYDWFEEQYK